MDNFPSGFLGKFLRLHNHYRSLHKTPPLEISDKLSEYAQEWADILAERGILAYRPQTEYGENIYVGHDIKPQGPLEEWYREGRFFKYGEEQVPNLQNVRHFTQMVWKDTKSIGLGLATGSDGKFYFVCNYDPPGNVDGQFASNIPSSLTEEADLPEHEAEAIRITEVRMDVVRSMERVYAVPSEKLRVWSAWLTKVGEVADEWQRWLRSYIDLTIRLLDNLQAAEDAIRQSEEGEDTLKRSLSGKSEAEEAQEAQDTVEESAQEDQEVVDEQETTEAPADETEGPAEEGETEETTEDLQAASEATLTPDKNEEKVRTWPIGIPWEPLGTVDEIEEEEFERLAMPRNEEEMRQLVQQFTQEATIFRSYYKHWSETADQAIKEIGGRLVMATYITQGKGRREKRRSSARSSRYFSALSGSIRSGTIPPAKSKSSTVEPAASVKSVTAEPKAEESDENEEFVTPEASKSDTPTVIENVPKASVASSKKLSKLAPSSVHLDVDDLVKDCARAAEPIPYFFYLKAEPDIDIAIEHDDQEVIPADLDRENVVAERKRLYFNLTDKPCKGGKPWL